MIDYPIYMVMVSYGKKNQAMGVIRDFLKVQKPVPETKLIIIENSGEPVLAEGIRDSQIVYFYTKNKNKARAINFAIGNLIPEKEALIICIDNDISFDAEYLIKIYAVAREKGNSFYFGTSFYVNKPKYDLRLKPFLSGSALGQPDLQFQKMKKLMFLGFSYAFFKSQWEKVEGLDERFSPGSKYDLAGEESIFQKKLQFAGYLPFFIEGNTVEHKPLPELYTLEKVIFRQKQNGFTHGFQNIISSTKIMKWDCVKILAGLMKRCVTLYFGNDRLKFKMKLAYTRGFLNSFFLYFRIEDRSNYLKISG